MASKWKPYENINKLLAEIRGQQYILEVCPSEYKAQNEAALGGLLARLARAQSIRASNIAGRAARAKAACVLTYQQAVEWVAGNDEPTLLKVDEIFGQATVCMLADVYGKSAERAARDVVRLRKAWKRNGNGPN